MCKEIQQKVHEVTSSATAETAGFVRRLVEIESKGWGDDAQALHRISNESRVSFWTLNNLRIGRAKSVSADVRDRIREALIKTCRTQAARLLHEADMAAKTGRGNDDLANIADQIRALAAELETAQGEQETDRRTQ